MTLERPATDFGSRLRDARERKGISIRQVSNNTKIAVAVLEGLERNDISKLPTGIFGRAFVRSFAAEVGLDPEASIQEFTEQFRENLAPVTHAPAEGVDDHDAREHRRQRRRRMLVAVAALVLVVGAAVAYVGVDEIENLWTMAVNRTQPDKVATAAPLQVSPAPVASAPSAAQQQPAAEGSASESPTSAAPGSVAPVDAVDRSPSDEPVDRLNVVLKVTRPCWVAATVDGRKEFQRVLKPGDERTLEARNELVLTVGDAGAVKMTINGMDAKSLGRSGEVLTERLNLSNVKRYLANQ
jgi:cytoskeletal protein RodZ